MATPKNIVNTSDDIAVLKSLFEITDKTNAGDTQQIPVRKPVTGQSIPHVHNKTSVASLKTSDELLATGHIPNIATGVSQSVSNSNTTILEKKIPLWVADSDLKLYQMCRTDEIVSVLDLECDTIMQPIPLEMVTASDTVETYTPLLPVLPMSNAMSIAADNCVLNPTSILCNSLLSSSPSSILCSSFLNHPPISELAQTLIIRHEHQCLTTSKLSALEEQNCLAGVFTTPSASISPTITSKL